MSEEEISLSGKQNDLSAFVSDEGGIWSLRNVEKIRGWNNIEYGAGLSGKNTPSTGLSMNGPTYHLEGLQRHTFMSISMS